MYALPRIIREVGDDYFESVRSKLRFIARYAYEKLSNIKGLTPYKTKAALYMMVKIHFEEFEDISDDVDFCKKFLAEE